MKDDFSHRPDPEKLLKRVQEEERHKLQGKLKIYLGAAPGVGKTYNMLQDAIEQRATGLDVVAGIVETHGRKDLDKFLTDLEILPRQEIEYRGQKLYEFNLDAALKRNPALILMDEMAHTNSPGSRHAKRWQDIKELLDRGIDVYTTLNVQHIESLNDVISQIIHAPVKETIPDSMLEQAETIELVDIPPEELLKRLHEGKVYIPKQAELAVEHFFRKGNLIALRELALRVTAERVNAQVLSYREGQSIKHVWPTKEKLLVCVGARSESTDVVRATRRLAASLQADWIAVHVDTPRFRLTEEQRNSTIQNLRLAEQLGAETKILAGLDIVDELINFAREQNVTTIVVGKRIRPRWKQIFSSSLADELVRFSREIDIYIITAQTELNKPKKITKTTLVSAPWRLYTLAIAIVALVTTINFFLFHYFYISSLLMIYFLGIAIVAMFGRKGPAILASVLSVLAFDFFFLPPFYSLWTGNLERFFTLVVMLIVGLVISYFAILSRRQAEVARLAEQHTATLHTLSRQLASTRGVDKLLNTAVNYIAKVFDSKVLAFIPENNHLTVKAADGAESALSSKELGVAQWVYDLGQIAGLGTDTLPYSDALYVPMLASQGSIGVLRIQPNRPTHWLAPEQMHLLESIANQIGLAIEVDRMQEHTRAFELQTEADRARNALLQSVSHDLRTPLVAAMGAASTLTEMWKDLERRNIKKLGNEIFSELEQLNRLINNLLQLTYLEGESAKLQKEPVALRDIISNALQALHKRLNNKIVNINIPDNFPLIPLDKVLMEEVFINLIDNAIKFTPLDTSVDISAQREAKKILVRVEDSGPGIMPDEVGRLFEKFYRGRMLSTERGMGLGLAICRIIIKAHRGDIWAENRPEGGAMFIFSLPFE